MGLMRCHITSKLIFLAFILCALPGAAFSQNAPIVLVENGQGQQVYIDPGTTPPELTSSKPAIPLQIQSLINQTAGRFQIDPKLVNAVIRVESGFDPHAVSRKGAEGLMQLIPATAERFGVADPFDSRQNIQGGVSYLRYLLDRFNGSVPLSLAAYNAGENRVDRDGGIPAIPETVNYVRKVTALYRRGAASRPNRPILGRKPKPARAAVSTQPVGQAPIYRYVDAWGVVHYSND